MIGNDPEAQYLGRDPYMEKTIRKPGFKEMIGTIIEYACEHPLRGLGAAATVGTVGAAGFGVGKAVLGRH